MRKIIDGIPKNSFLRLNYNKINKLGFILDENIMTDSVTRSLNFSEIFALLKNLVFQIETLEKKLLENKVSQS